ncbi:MAG: hypothetical protein OER85_09090, partial [Gammaproteobacteria bacterium]|nr:hypothetical protein [Gammaproteobacteria bacterium]
MMTKSGYPFGFRARARFVLMGLVLLALSAPANAQFAGVYMGDVTDIPGTTPTGWFAIQVNDDGSAFAIFYDFTPGITPDGGSVDNITVKPDGSFAFDLPHPNPDAVQPGGKVVGIFAGGSVSGDVCDFTPNSGDPGCPGSMGNNPIVGKFSATRSPATGLFAQFGGIYVGTMTGAGTSNGLGVTAEGPLVAIADALGQALILGSPRLKLGDTPQGVIDIAGRVEVDPTAPLNFNLSRGGNINGTINFLLNPPSGSGSWTINFTQANLSGTWTLARVKPLPTQGPDADIDVTGVTDISGDGVPDVGELSQPAGNRPRMRYYSGANRQQFDQVNYLSNAWAAVAAATVADGNQDGVRNDPAVAVLGRNIATNKLFVQVRMA